MKKLDIAAQLRCGVAPVILAAALISPSIAMAQDEPQEAQEAGFGENVIVVTGSRIVSAAAETTAPVQVVNEAAIAESGVTNIQALLLKNPTFGTPTISRTNSSFNSATSGIAVVDLRNLGTERTLVLVNGRRFVAGIPGENAVDLNSIPTALIERVEVLTSGAGSAIYGSDAVAGTVNFILKKDFEGIEANALTGITEAGDDFRYQADLTIGGNFADGRGNATVYFGYTNEEGAYKRKRKTEQGSAALDSISLGLLSGLDGDLFKKFEPFYSSYSPQGTYFTDNFAWTYDQNGRGALRPCVATNGGTAPATCGAFAGQAIGPDGFNRSAYRLTVTPVERFLINANAHYEISDSITAFVEASFASHNSVSNIEPFASATDDVYQDGAYPIETLDPNTNMIVVNPYVPAAIYNDASDTNGDGLRDIFITKRLVDFGPRSSEARRETFRIVAGLEGEFTKGWNYETYFNYGQTVTAQLGTGQYNVLNYREAAKIIPDGNGGYMCADPNAVAEGCVPANVFGLNSLSPEAINYLAAPSSFNATVKQTVIGANVSGELFSITPSAPVAVVVGTEYRRESSTERWDPLQTLGLNASNAFPPTSGKFDLYEFYGEALVPIIRESIVHDFTVRGAVRYSDYSTIGSTFSWNAGAEFAPIEDIRFRAMYAVTVRAPNIAELYDGLNQTFPTVQDPCEGVTNDGSALATNCMAFAGVTANMAANGGVFTLTQADRQGVTGFEGGNPNLQEEKGKTFTVGVTINPKSIDALRNLSLSIDYFNIDIEDAIVSTPRQYILDQCFQQGAPAFCQFIVRRPVASGPNNAGSLDEVNTGPSNSGGWKTKGIDVVLNYAHAFDVGSTRLNSTFSFSYTHLMKSYQVPLPGSAKDRFDGEVGSSVDRFTTNFGIGTDDFKLAFSGTYVGEAYLDDQFTGVLAGENKDYRIHPEFYLDTQARFYIGDTMEMFLGVDNVFNNKPVYTASIPGASDTGQDAFGGTYDPLGRRYYMGAKLRF
ncbi:MAG: TonB-dependent receptor [Sphingobium sp.]|nr:TonB-dependent receptor [Sphingobium sp.]MCP5398449.1 TonB-dependent receptor [Sphingomonas sp.]